MKTHTCLKALFTVLVFTVSVSVSAQETVSYGYDASGNRVSRIIVFDDPLRSGAVVPREESPAVYSEMLSEIEVKIYPNPTDGLLKVELYNLPENVTAHILLYNLSGKLVNSHPKVSDLIEINISAQPPGIYLMKIVAGDYQTEWKIIKR